MAQPVEPPHDTASLDLMIHRWRPNQSSQDSPSFAYVRSGADGTTHGRSWSCHSSHCDSQPHDAARVQLVASDPYGGFCRQLLRPNDTAGGAPARGWRTFCPSLACVLERQKCATGGSRYRIPARKPIPLQNCTPGTAHAVRQCSARRAEHAGTHVGWGLVGVAPRTSCGRHGTVGGRSGPAHQCSQRQQSYHC